MDENELMEYFGVSDESGSTETGTAEGQTSEDVTTGGVPPESGRSDGETAGGTGEESQTPETAGQPQSTEPGQGSPGQAAPGQRGTEDVPGRSGMVRPGNGGERDELRRGEAYLDNAIRSLGIKDPYTGKDITTKAEYDAYQRRLSDERMENIRRKAGLTEDEFNEFVSNLPEVRKAKEDSRRLGEMIRRQRETEARAKVDAELAKIRAMDPTVKTLADLTTQENYQELYGYVKRGYDISDAWRLANFDKLRRSSAEASRQAALNAQNGKSGMVRTKQAGEGNDSVPVPEGVAEIYRGLMPDLSAADMRADYNKYLKRDNK